MTTCSDGDPDSEFWRQPSPIEQPPGPASSKPEAATGRPDPPPYAGPPPATPPPPGWRPPLVVQPPPPRQLPGQDLDGIEAEEHSARAVTYGVALAAGAVLLVVVCLLCSRVVF